VPDHRPGLRAEREALVAEINALLIFQNAALFLGPAGAQRQDDGNAQHKNRRRPTEHLFDHLKIPIH